MPISIATTATLLGYSATLLGTAIYSTLFTPRTNYGKQVRENITSDMESVLRDAKVESRTIPKKDAYTEFAQAFHGGLIEGYEKSENGVSPVAGQSAFLDSVYAIAEDYGSTYHVFETPDDRGMMNPRQVSLEEITELAKTTFATWAEVDYMPPWE